MHDPNELIAENVRLYLELAEARELIEDACYVIDLNGHSRQRMMRRTVDAGKQRDLMAALIREWMDGEKGDLRERTFRALEIADAEAAKW